MFKRKLRYEVVPEGAYTDFSDRYEEDNTKSSPSNGILMTAGVAATASLATMAVTKYTNPTTIAPPIPLPTETTMAPVLEPTNVLSTPISTPSDLYPVTFNGTSNPEIIQTGFIGDSAMAAFATIFDPIVEIIVAISLPLASVVVAAAGLLLILGKDDKALSMIIKAGIGYVAVQLLPLFITIMKTMGKVAAG